MGTPGDRDFVVRTGGHCCLCLTKVPSQLPPVKVEVEPGTTESNSFQPKQSVSNGLHSLQYVSRYLELNLGVVAGPDPKGKLEEPRLRAILCEGCGALNDRFPELHRERDRIQTEVTAGLSDIHEKLCQPEPEEESTMEETSEESLGEEDVRILEDVRRSLMEKCSLKLKRPPPRAEINELVWEEDSEMDEERPDVKIEKERDPLLDSFEGDANSGHSWNSSGDDESSEVKLEEDADEATDEEVDSITVGERATRSSPNSSVKINVTQNPTTGNYQCPEPECETELSTQRSAERHYKSVHLKLKKCCDICGGSFSNLAKHRRVHLKLRNIACLLCGIAFNEQRALTNHTNAVHLNSRPHRCDKCGKKFARKLQLQLHHDAVHTSVKRYQCDLCERRFASEQLLRRHRRDVHLKSKLSDRGPIRSSRGSSVSVSVGKNPTTGKFTCPSPTCETEFTTQRSAERHYRCVHLKPNRNFCDICGRSFRHLAKHHRSVHLNLRPYECNECEKQFSRKAGLELHKAIAHTNDKRYQCDLCEKRFPTELYLRRHRKNVHLKLDQATIGESSTKSDRISKHIQIRSSPETGSRLKVSVTKNPTTGNYKCPAEHECEGEFTNKNSAERHYRLVHLKLRPYQCNECEKQFGRKQQLQRHQVVHTNIKRYQCALCEKRFPSEHHLQRHRRAVHLKPTESSTEISIEQNPTTGNYKCPEPECEKEFSIQGETKRHYRYVHLGVRPRSAPCEECGKTFSTAWTLKTHFDAVHLKIKHNCGECGKLFSRLINLQRHRRKFHDTSSLRNHVKSIQQKNRRWKCNLCGEQFGLKSMVNRHYRNVHPSPSVSVPRPRPWSKTKRGKEKYRVPSPSPSDLENQCENEHQDTPDHGNSGAGPSETKDATGPGPTSKSEAVTGPKLKLDATPEAGKSMDETTRKSLLQRSANMSFEVDPNTGKSICPGCNKRYSKYEVRRHYRSVHLKIDLKLKRFPCDLCEKQFHNRHGLENHRVAIHLKLKPYRCEECGMQFSQRQALNTHWDGVHLKLKRYECGQCEMEFCYAAERSEHRKRVHLKVTPQHRCDECGKEFFKNHLLLKHKQAVHPKVKRYKCDECGALFGTNSLVVRHKRDAHPKDKKWTCDQCGKMFSDKSKLNAHHQVVHLNVRHICDQCGKLFTDKSRLDQHHKTAHLNFRYSCDQCGKQYKQMRNLRDHYRIAHPETAPAQPESGVNVKLEPPSSLRQGEEEEGAEVDVDNRGDMNRDDPNSTEESSSEYYYSYDKTTRQFKCSFCNEVTSSPKDAYAHHRREHLKDGKSPGAVGDEPGKHCCDQCGKEFSHKLSLTRHQEGPCPGGTRVSIPCPECGEIVGKYCLYYHKHPEIPFSENMLNNLLDPQIPAPPRQRTEGEGVKLDPNPNSREKSSSDYYTYDKSTRRFKCNLCEEVFISPKDAHLHYQRDHVRVNQVNVDQPMRNTCDQCGKNYSCHQALREHYNSVHLGLGYKCPVCSKAFTTNKTLRRHLYQMSCNKGGKSSASNDDNAIRSYECPLCKEEFGGTEAHKAAGRIIPVRR